MQSDECVKTCRICLLRKNETISIFKELDSTKITERILFCTNVLIKDESDLPNSICRQCLGELDISYKFKEKCQYSEHSLLQCKLEKDDFSDSFTPVAGSRSDQSEDEHNFHNTDIRSNSQIKCPPSSKIIDKRASKLAIIQSENNFKNERCIIEPCATKGGRKSKTAETKKCDEKQQVFKCETCELQCRTKFALKVHMRIHSGEKPFQCELCLKRFVSTSNLNMHKKMTHNDEKQVCSECGKSFSCLPYLKRHLVTHYDVKPFGCTICEKRFTTKTYLKEHIARHKGDKRFFCEICASKFISEVNLKQHKLIHGVQGKNFKKHQCTFCDYKTIGREDLARHIRKHTGEKPYRCSHDGCTLSFSSKASRRLHERLHTGERPFACTECPAKYIRGDKCKNHMLKKHNIKDVGPSDRSRLVIRELAEATKEGKKLPIYMDIIKTLHYSKSNAEQCVE